MISIPDIDVDWTFVEGVGPGDLRKGPGHYPGTALPGQNGNVAIAGHRTTWGAPFNRLDELEPGDSIFLTTLAGSVEYRVIAQQDGAGHFIVNPSDVEVVGDSDTPILTLTSPHPKFSARQRIVVQAELIGEATPFPDRTTAPTGADLVELP